MRVSRFSFVLAILAVSMATSTSASAQAPATAATEEAAVRAAAQGFAQALAKGDSLAALGFLHDDVLVLEGGRAENKTQYRSSHLAADIRYLATVKSEILKEGVTVSGDTALYTRQYRVTGMSARGAPIDRTSNESLLLVKTAQGWKVRHVHWG
jgi:ketosteroid isomerase-like protein